MRKLLCIFLSLASALFAQEAHMVVEAYSGKVLSAQNSTAKRPVASLTKMATAIVAVDWATATNTDIATQMIRVPDIVLQLNSPSTIKLAPGDSLTLRDAPTYTRRTETQPVKLKAEGFIPGGKITTTEQRPFIGRLMPKLPPGVRVGRTQVRLARNALGDAWLVPIEALVRLLGGAPAVEPVLAR